MATDPKTWQALTLGARGELRGTCHSCGRPDREVITRAHSARRWHCADRRDCSAAIARLAFEVLEGGLAA